MKTHLNGLLDEIHNSLAANNYRHILEKKHLKAHLLAEKEKALVLMERRSLKVEVIDLKALPLKNTVKEELKPKTF